MSVPTILPRPVTLFRPETRPPLRGRALVALVATVLVATALAGTVPALAEEGAAKNPWLTSLDEALAQARASERLVLVDLYAEWCGWCKTLESQVFTDPRFLRFAERFVLLRVDVMDRAEGSELQARYGAFSLPTTLILDAQQVHVGTVEGFAPVGPFLDKLKAELVAWDRAKNRRSRHMASRDPGVLVPLARELHGLGDGERAAVIYARLLELGGDLGISQAWLRYLEADALHLAGHLDQAQASLLISRREAAAEEDPALLEAVELLSIRLDHSRGDCDGAAGALRAFLTGYPESSFRRQAQESLRSIESGQDPACS